jgi:hypothetical protein
VVWERWEGSIYDLLLELDGGGCYSGDGVLGLLGLLRSRWERR